MELTPADTLVRQFPFAMLSYGRFFRSDGLMAIDGASPSCVTTLRVLNA